DARGTSTMLTTRPEMPTDNSSEVPKALRIRRTTTSRELKQARLKEIIEKAKKSPEMTKRELRRWVQEKFGLSRSQSYSHLRSAYAIGGAGKKGQDPESPRLAAPDTQPGQPGDNPPRLGQEEAAVQPEPVNQFPHSLRGLRTIISHFP